MPRCLHCHRRLAAGQSCPRDGWTAPASELVQLDPRDRLAIPGFVLGNMLGGGGFALVWSATREQDGAGAAVKIGRSDHPLLVERFAREADALRGVGPPYAPSWLANGVVQGRPYIAMEHIRGETLSQRIAAHLYPPSLPWIEQTADHVLAALEALHAEGWVHRDLKPDNLMIVAPEERIVLLDYGLCKRVESAQSEPHRAELTRTGVVVGTPEYMAPEQIRDHEHIDARADLYAFGVLLFELFTLRVPFAGQTNMLERGHLSLKPPRPSDFAQVPPPHEQIILACLAKDPARRPKSATDLRRALREASRFGAAPTEVASAAHAPVLLGGSRKLLAEGRHLAAIMVAEIQGPAAGMLAMVRAHKGYVVRQRGAQYTALFSGFDTDNPADAALGAARELAEKGGRAALHLASVTIRRKDRGAPSAYGAAIERPETWIPAQPWAGVVLSDEFQRVLPSDPLHAGDVHTQAPETDASPRSGSREQLAADSRDGVASSVPVHQSAERSAEIDRPMVGRDDTLAAIAASFGAAVEQQVPRLATLIGDAGLGKTRLVAEAAAGCGRSRPDVRVVSLAAAPPGSGDDLSDSMALLRSVVDVPDPPPPDPRAFWVQALGEEIGEAAAPFVGALLGWNPRPTTDGSPQRMRAIAEALRRKARNGPVAVLLDDAHRADDALLDALEYITLDGEQLPLWVLVAAAPSFDQGRRSWGRRTRYHDRIDLRPLSDETAVELAASLLLPAEYPPSSVLDRLAHWAGGNPFCLKEIVRALKRAGIVRRRPHGGSYYVATADVEALPPVPAWQWLAVRQLDAMPPELAACVRLCSVLGVTFTRAEAEWVQDALDRVGDAGTPLDIGFALTALLDRRVLRRGEADRFSFQNGVLQDAVYEMLEQGQRRKVHRHAFELWQSSVHAAEHPDLDALERLARHAAALGEQTEAAGAYLKLGDAARANHKDTEADRYYSLALQQAPEDNLHCQANARLGRGRSRYRVARVKEALEDFEAARVLAETLSNPEMHAEVLLEEATALEWSREFEASAKRVEQARPIIETLGAKHLLLQLRVAEGRTAFRQNRLSQSIALLEQAVTEARASGDYETRMIGLLLLSSQLAIAGHLDEAEMRFQEVITLATEANDGPHLCAAYSNRVVLWLGRREPHQATHDLHLAIHIARQIGNPWLERLASHNVATLLHWSDQRTEALALSRRACLLEDRFFERPVAFCSLLLACILMMIKNFGEAAQVFLRIAQACPPDGSNPDEPVWLYHMIHLVLAEFAPARVQAIDMQGTWEDVIAAARADPQAEVVLEALYWRACVALHRGHMDEAEQALAEVRLRSRDCPMWPTLFGALEDRLAELQAQAVSR